MSKRDPYLVERDLQRYRDRNKILFPGLESTPDISRGETRLAAEVTIAIMLGIFIPPAEKAAFESAKLKAYDILKTLAQG